MTSVAQVAINAMTRETRPLTWEDLVAREPHLADLLERVSGIRDTGETPSFCANHLWLEVFRPELFDLVGWLASRKDGVLRSSAAYDVAYKRIYNALPACRDCSCFW